MEDHEKESLNNIAAQGAVNFEAEESKQVQGKKGKLITSLVLIIIGLCLLIFLGLKTIALLAGLVLGGSLVYCISKKKKVPKVLIVATVACLALAVILPGKSGGSGDYIDLMGETQAKIVKQYGEFSKGASGDYSNGQGLSYVIGDSGTVNMVFMNGGNGTLAGISIGDDLDQVREAMKNFKADLTNQQSGVAIIYSFESKQYAIDVAMKQGVVTGVDAYDVG